MVSSQTIHTWDMNLDGNTFLFKNFCHDILKWRQRPNMTIAVDWDTKPLIKQIDLGSCQIVSSILWDFYLKLGCHYIRKCFEIHVYNKFVCLVGLTKQLFFWQTQTFLVVTSDQVVHQFFISFAWWHKQPIYFYRPQYMVVANFFFFALSGN